MLARRAHADDNGLFQADTGASVGGLYSGADELYNGTWQIYSADGAPVGAVSFDKYEPPPGDERNEAAIYAPIAELFDVAGSCKRLISNETYEIATVAVRRDGKENFGILCYNTELNVYVAFEFDGERVSEEEVEAMAGVVGLM